MTQDEAVNPAWGAEMERVMIDAYQRLITTIRNDPEHRRLWAESANGPDDDDDSQFVEGFVAPTIFVCTALEMLAKAVGSEAARQLVTAALSTEGDALPTNREERRAARKRMQQASRKGSRR